MSRNTTLRDKHRDIIKRDEPPCFCGQPIDYQAHHLDPSSFVVDHITPLSRGGTDTLDNKQAAHRRCNNEKYNKVVHVPVIFVTDRNWS